MSFDLHGVAVAIDRIGLEVRLGVTKSLTTVAINITATDIR